MDESREEEKVVLWNRVKKFLTAFGAVLALFALFALPAAWGTWIFPVLLVLLAGAGALLAWGLTRPLRRLEADPALEVQPRPWNLGPRALARIPVEEGSAYYRGVLLRQIQTGRTGDQLENMTALLARLGEPSGSAKEEGEKKAGGRLSAGEAASGALETE